MNTRMYLSLSILICAGACKSAGTGGGGPLPSPEAALEQLRAPGEARRSVRASGRLTYFGDKGRVRVRTIILAERPASFRVETVSPFDQPLEVMTGDGSRISLLSKGKLYEGPSTMHSLARLLPLALAPEELVDLMLGGVPSATGFSAESIEWEKGRWRLTLRRLGTAQQALLWVDPERLELRELRWLEADGVRRLSVRFDDFKDDGAGGRLPREIVVQVPGEDTDVRIKLKSVEVNAKLDASLFAIPAPAGQQPEPL